MIRGFGYGCITLKMDRSLLTEIDLHNPLITRILVHDSLRTHLGKQQNILDGWLVGEEHTRPVYTEADT